MEANLKPLTPKEQQLLRRIREYIALNGHAPTLDELAAAARTTKVTVYEKVASLERKGYIKKDKHKSRAITILHDNPMEELRRVKKELRQVREAFAELVSLAGWPKAVTGFIEHTVRESYRATSMGDNEINDLVSRLTNTLSPAKEQS